MRFIAFESNRGGATADLYLTTRAPRLVALPGRIAAMRPDRVQRDEPSSVRALTAGVTRIKLRMASADTMMALPGLDTSETFKTGSRPRTPRER